MKKYKTLKKGDKLRVPDKTKFFVGCCDCGLVHSWELEIKNDSLNSFLSFEEREIIIKMNRDNRRTGQKRRWLVKNKILKPISGGAGVFFPIGRPPEGTCFYATDECLKKCCALEKDFDEEYNVFEREKKMIYNFFISNHSIDVCRKIMKEMGELQARVLHWFTTGDCLDKDMQKLFTIMKELNNKGIIQNGFTRNVHFYKNFILENEWLCIIPTFNPKFEGDIENVIYAVPDYKTGRNKLYYNDVQYGSCGYSSVETFDIEISTNCLGCYKRKIGCFVEIDKISG